MKPKFELSPELVGKFKVVNTDSPLLHSKIGDLDFRKATLEQAEALFNAGTRYLVKIQPAGVKRKKRVS
ncbi:hypothetical protein [Pedobacter ginsengisoli]|uniref:hypothetical protein n=1 Tax=Pedobacter ginsengisoli TaxID=363852 RepID=UPI00254BCA5D|nr:hypothetical protein [Pedobacter ginsengisoli]